MSDPQPTLPGGADVEDADLAVLGEGVCETCATVVDADELLCGTCGARLPAALDATQPPPPALRCGPCGASTVTWGADGQCGYCGSADVTMTGGPIAAAPTGLIPFSVVEGEARVLLASWVGFPHLKPAALSRPGAAGSLRRVFIPHWLFTSDVHTCWTADTDEVPDGRRGQWAPVFGETSSTVTGLLIAASGVLPQRHSDKLGHYDLRALAPCDWSLPAGAPAEAPAVARRTARAVARSRLIAREHARCAALLAPRRLRHLRVNPLLENMKSTLVLLPAWVLTYRHRGRVRRFVLNGQSGGVRGTAPLCPLRIGAAVAVMTAVMVVFWFLLSRS
ncbi:MAG: hypothetical protein AMXMBFR64_45150 [Myxococcales bacterium]